MIEESKITGETSTMKHHTLGHLNSAPPAGDGGAALTGDLWTKAARVRLALFEHQYGVISLGEMVTLVDGLREACSEADVALDDLRARLSAQEAEVARLTMPNDTPDAPRAEPTMYNFPRRHQMLKWTPAEMAIAAAVQRVEEAGCDVRLTDAVILLGRARDAVADFVDNVPRRDLLGAPTGETLPVPPVRAAVPTRPVGPPNRIIVEGEQPPVRAAAGAALTIDRQVAELSLANHALSMATLEGASVEYRAKLLTRINATEHDLTARLSAQETEIARLREALMQVMRAADACEESWIVRDMALAALTPERPA